MSNQNTKHTPGPWNVRPDTMQVYNEVGLMCEVATVSTCHVDQWNQGSSKANARLIAAAPEMLQLIQQIVDEQESFGEHGDAKLISECLTMIHKATGGAE